MKPKIEQTTFGSITIKGEVYEHDVIIRLNGEVKKRKKKLSKSIYGTSHIVSTEEAKYIYEKGAKQIIIGTGQSGMVKISDEAGNDQLFDNLKKSIMGYRQVICIICTILL